MSNQPAPNVKKPEGVIVPLFTPITEDGKVDAPSLQRLVERSIAAGVHGLFVGGSAGMGPMLTEYQWESALETVLNAAGDRALVLSGIIATSTQRALQQIAVSRLLGCSTIVVTPTYYIALRTHDEMMAHFRACRDATDQQMLIYNIPSCTASSIPVATVRAVAECGWAVAMKESSGDREYFTKVLEAAQGSSMVVLQGNEPDIAWGLRSGAAGIVPVCANCEPETFVAAVNAARPQDWEKLDAIQKQIDAVRDTMLVGDHNWIAGLACSCHAIGVGNGIPLPPLQPVGLERRVRINRYFQPQESATGAGK